MRTVATIAGAMLGLLVGAEGRAEETDCVGALGAITVKRRGNVRRAKLYYLRERTGKSARIEEKV